MAHLTKRSIILLASCVILLGLMTWIMIKQNVTQDIAYKEPKIIVVIPLDPGNSGTWLALRENAKNRDLLNDNTTIVTCVGRSEAVWIYEWLWLNKGREAAFSFLDWISNDATEKNVIDWLKENGYPTIGEMRRWCEDHPHQISAEFRRANEKALSVEDKQISIFGGSFSRN